MRRVDPTALDGGFVGARGEVPKTEKNPDGPGKRKKTGKTEKTRGGEGEGEQWALCGHRTVAVVIRRDTAASASGAGSSEGRVKIMSK